MDIVQIFVLLIIVGVALYLVNRYVPMAESVKTILNVVVILLLCVWLLRVFGILGPVYVPRR